MNINADIRNLGKWLNEEQTAPIDRQALARLLAWAQMADKPAAWVYPEFFEGITKAGCWTAYAGDGVGQHPDGVKRIPLYRGALTGGDERRHIICLCPDCTEPAQKQELCPSCRNGSIYACTCTFKPAQQQEPVYFCDYGYEGWDKVDAAMAAANLADGMTVEAYYTSPQPSKPNDCARSHPHEDMDSMCELRTEIARLTNENARLKAQQQKPLAFPQEAAAFKAWFDAWYIGDGEQGETIPGQSDPHFLTYVDQYTLGFGSWMAAKHAARAGT